MIQPNYLNSIVSGSFFGLELWVSGGYLSVMAIKLSATIIKVKPILLAWRKKMSEELDLPLCIAVAKKYYRGYPFANDDVRAQYVAILARDIHKNPTKYRESTDD